MKLIKGVESVNLKSLPASVFSLPHTYDTAAFKLRVNRHLAAGTVQTRCRVADKGQLKEQARFLVIRRLIAPY